MERSTRNKLADAATICIVWLMFILLATGVWSCTANILYATGAGP